MFELQTEIKDKMNFGISLDAIDDHKRKKFEYLERSRELKFLTAERDIVQIECKSLQKRRLDEFMYGFNIICINLKEIYQMITFGGDAELELVDSINPFSNGVFISVRPPNKSWKIISNLSGGEKTLSSLSLVLALHRYKPAPFYMMDEIDAALDFRNVSIVLNISYHALHPIFLFLVTICKIF